METGRIFKTQFGGREITVETGRYAQQANGSCVVRCGDTAVLVCVTMSAEPREGIDYFPLGVDYEEKMYSVGKIPGSFKRREGRASDKAILTSRLIDRPLRPLFPKGFFNDVSVVATVLSVEPDVFPEVLSMLGSSIALSISDIPFYGPTGSVAVGYIDGKYILNPDAQQKAASLMHIYVSGTKDAILMVEAGAQQVSEETVLGGIMFAHEEIKKLVAFQEEIVAEIGKPKAIIDYYKIPEEIDTAVREFADKLLDEALDTTDREQRQKNEDEVNKTVQEHFAEIFPEKKRDIDNVLYNMTKEKVRAKILEQGKRPDGRKLNEIRPIWSEVGVLPRVHGSGVFTRGQTQVMSTATLGTISDFQKLEGLDEESLKRFMHHYNFPPYSTGEAKPLRAPSRREIGHGALAERALEAIIPSQEEFPYAIRLVSEVLSSNGSTSQASICASCLALMDAGVPIKAPVAGIAMGLVKDEHSSRIAVLSDIQGLEDFLGDMDFKVAGTKEGVTAIQMDIKIKGIDENILKTALQQAREGRMHILGEMQKTLAQPRAELSPYAPKIISFTIDPEKIGDVIGKSGKVINKIIEETGTKIDIQDDGTVMIACQDLEKADLARKKIEAIVVEPEVGFQYRCKINRIEEFGAFAEIAPGKDGLIHISKLSNKRVEKVTDVLNLDDEVIVEVIKVSVKDGKKRIDLKLLEIANEQ